MSRRNVVLIGMPGAGKSTVGVILAKHLGFDFLDTDVAIQAQAGRRLQEIINADGLAAFRRLEEAAILALQAESTVIATGGSVVYSAAAMAALKGSGLAVFLDLPLAELEARVKDMDSRGLVIAPGQSYADLYRERLPLYRRFADLSLDCQGRSVAEIAGQIVARLEEAGLRGR